MPANAAIPVAAADLRKSRRAAVMTVQLLYASLGSIPASPSLSRGELMKHLGGVVAVASITFAAAAAAGPAPRDYPVKPVPFTAVHFADAFWLPRIETNRTVSIPFAFQKCEETKRVYNFERAGAVLRGEEVKDKTPPGYPFDDTDLYKVIEGAAYTLTV